MSSTIYLFLLVIAYWSPSHSDAISSPTPCFLNHYHERTHQEFEQKTDRFFRFEEQSNTWVDVDLPYELVACRNKSCTKVGSINRQREGEAGEVENWSTEKQGKGYDLPNKGESSDDNDGGQKDEERYYEMILPFRKRLSVTKLSEASIWVTGESGSIYERFWNGMHWVIVPHDLPMSAGPAKSVFFVNQTILSLSEAGFLYQMGMNENSQPAWVEFPVNIVSGSSTDAEQISKIYLKTGVVSHNGERVYFCTKNGWLLELAEVEPPRWINHGQPPGADVAAIADANTVRLEVVFTVSSAGDLYEHDKNSKPSWKKHIWADESEPRDTSLVPLRGCSVMGVHGSYSISLFLLTKAGTLAERRLHKRKWRWIAHRSPEKHQLTSVMLSSNEKSQSLFFTTASGSILEYQLTKDSAPGIWTDHAHPPQARAAKGIHGVLYRVGRLFYPLDDGRLAEFHLSSIGGENSGPNHQVNIKRKSAQDYVWSVLDAPESEGWNAEYCTEERGPHNCISGMSNAASTSSNPRPVIKRRKGQIQQNYLIPDGSPSVVRPSNWEEYKPTDEQVSTNFRLRLMHRGRSFFLVTDYGLTLEHIYGDSMGLWLRHEHNVSMKSVVGTYNGSLFLVDENGALMIRERSNCDLGWTNCTAMRKGKQISSGRPWDGIPHKTTKVTPDDALFFVSKSGRLLQFKVAQREFRWKDCKSPPQTKVASIVDQELLRDNIVFVVGSNGRLYQYNKVSGLWHEHYKSPHLVLSRLAGTAMRTSASTLKGSLFMISQGGGLVEYHWNRVEGWGWVEHGTPHRNVSFFGAPGPTFEGNQLLLIDLEGNVYLRYFDGFEWRWKNYGYPSLENMGGQEPKKSGEEKEKEEEGGKGICIDGNLVKEAEDEEHINSLSHMSRYCDPRVSDTRPIPFGEDSAIFQLRDGRLAEIRRVNNFEWTWQRTIATPSSMCMANYWTAIES